MLGAQILVTGHTGAKRQSWFGANPRDVLIQLSTKHSDEESLRDAVWAVIGNDNNMVRTIFEYWFANNYRSLFPPHMHHSPPLPPRRAQRAQRAAVVQQVVQEVQHKIRIKLLDMILPNNKPLREATREELLHIGGWVSEVAQLLQPGQTVGAAKLSEALLRRMYSATP